jgi:hypothetical protein
MKIKFLIPLMAGCGLCLAQFTALAQDFKTHISKEFTLTNPNATFVGIYNLFGSIKVEGYAGDKVTLEIEETISGDTNADIEQGKKEFKMGYEQKADTLLTYIAAPYDTKPHFGRYYYHNDDHEIHYKVQLEMTVKVPYNVYLRANTVNEGNIDVKNVYGQLRINNVNGPINIENAKGITDAKTINGNLTVTYLSIPKDASNYYTLNGKLTVTYPKDLSADLQFKSMNGGFYTDFDDTEVLPVQVTKTVEKKSGGTTYKLNKNPLLRVGSGGKLFRFETLNGNIYIKKQS